MSQPQQPESTYRSYTTNQASTYNRARGSYPERLISHIVQQHTLSGGQPDLVVDVGCGPGNCTQQLAPNFRRAVGVDPSPQMIEVARELLLSSPSSSSSSAAADANVSSSPAIDFQIGEAEALDTMFPTESIDLLTAATAAHWFDMSRFWRSAEKVVRPGGTVALFMIWRAWVNPSSCERAAEFHDVIRKLEMETLAEWEREGNWCVIGLYRDLAMPWQLNEDERIGLEGAFPRELARRVVWNEDGRPSEEDGEFMSGERLMTIEQVQEMLGSQSAVTRWREAHPELARGKDDHVVQAMKEIRQILGPGVNEIRMVGPTVLWLLKKKA